MCCRAGADLREECSVKDAVLDKSSGMWTITLDDDTTFRARVIACTLASCHSACIYQRVNVVIPWRNETLNDAAVKYFVVVLL